MFVFSDNDDFLFYWIGASQTKLIYWHELYSNGIFIKFKQKFLIFLGWGLCQVSMAFFFQAFLTNARSATSNTNKHNTL